MIEMNQSFMIITWNGSVLISIFTNQNGLKLIFDKRYKINYIKMINTAAIQRYLFKPLVPIIRVDGVINSQAYFDISFQ